MDADVDVPHTFFDRLKWAEVDGTGPVAAVIDGEAESVDVGGYRLVVVDHGVTALEGWFLVADATPGPEEAVEEWLRRARRLSKCEWAEALAATVGGRRVTDDGRATVLVSVDSDGTLEQRTALAGHLATRAPRREELHRTSATGVETLSERHHRFVTSRTSGFVVGHADDSDFFRRKFPSEIRNQYTLAVVLTLWQRQRLAEVQAQLEGAWTTANDSGRVKRGSQLRHRFGLLRALRGDHAVLLASGTFGPVFDSGSQAQFWSEIQRVHAIDQRRRELEDSMSALAQSTDTEASLSLERLLGFFTLVIGVPSLAFSVLGVNIARVTADRGLSGLAVVLILLMCLALGALAFRLAGGLGMTVRHDEARPRTPAFPPQR